MIIVALVEAAFLVWGWAAYRRQNETAPALR